MFNRAKKEFSAKYPGLINALKNTFKDLEIKTQGFFSSDSEVYLRSNLTLGDNQLNVCFQLSQNKKKYDDIEYDIDYDYFIHNKTNNKPKRFNLNGKFDFCDISSKYDYIKYLNHLGIKNHLLSKYTGGPLGNINTSLSGSANYFEKINIIKDQQKTSMDNNGTIYDALGKPQGVIKHSSSWYMANQKSVSFNGNTITFFDYENADLFDGYKHKSNFVLHIEIKNKSSILYETYRLLDTSNMKEIKLTDYENVKKNIDAFLEYFEHTPMHDTLCKNFNTISLVKELTGKTFLKKHNQRFPKSNVAMDFSKLSHDELILLVNDFMVDKINTEILVFESSGFSLVNGNYLNPIDTVDFATKMKQTESILKNCLSDFLEMARGEETKKLLLSKIWDHLIREALRSEIEKFQIRNNVKLLNKN